MTAWISAGRRGRRAIAALVVMAAAGGLLLGYAHGLGPWTSAATRHLRAMKDRARAPDTVETMTFPQLAALPGGLPWTAIGPIERRGVRVEGWVTRVLHSTDGDIHLDLSPEPVRSSVRGGEYLVAEITPKWRRGSRGWSDRILLPALRPVRTGASAAARRARLTGWLLDDYWNDPHRFPWTLWPHGGARRMSAWEIHPVTRIELWEDSLQRYVELPR